MEPGLRENPVGKSVHVYSYFTFIERVILDSCITKCIYLFIIFYLKLTSHHRMPAETKGEWTKRTLFKHTSLLKNSNDIFICCGFLLFCSMFMICSCAREGREEAILLHKKKKQKNKLPDEVPTVTPSIWDLLSNQRAATWEPTQRLSVWISNVCHKSCLILPFEVINCLNR